VALILSRQNLPTLDRTKYASAAGVARGGYVLADPPGGAKPDVILIGTGSELSLCVTAYEQLTAAGKRVRVVSLPSWELFDQQDEAYRHSVLPPEVASRVAVEAGVSQGWERYLGPNGRFIGMTGFGASAPAPALFKHFNITVERIVAEAQVVAGLTTTKGAS
jgi:transketolase